MRAIVPYRFYTGANLDADHVNANLQAIARDVTANQEERYTYCRFAYHLDNVSDLTNVALRTFYIRRPGANNACEVLGVELILYGNAAVTATLSCSDTNWPSQTVTTSATTTTEVYTSRFFPTPITSSSSDLTFTVDFSAAYTVTRGVMVVHLRSDRANQGTALVPYVPNLINARSAAAGTLGTLLDAELTAAEAAVTNDAAMATDLRCECFAVRSLASGSARTIRLPSGAGRVKLGATLYNFQAVAGTLRLDVDAQNTTLAGAGATTKAVASLAIAGTLNDDPMDSADDCVVTLTAGGGQTCNLGYALLWWS